MRHLNLRKVERPNYSKTRTRQNFKRRPAPAPIKNDIDAGRWSSGNPHSKNPAAGWDRDGASRSIMTWEKNPPIVATTRQGSTAKSAFEHIQHFTFRNRESVIVKLIGRVPDRPSRMIFAKAEFGLPEPRRLTLVKLWPGLQPGFFLSRRNAKPNAELLVCSPSPPEGNTLKALERHSARYCPSRAVSCCVPIFSPKQLTQI